MCLQLHCDLISSSAFLRPEQAGSGGHHDAAVIECEFTLATFSTAQRRARFRGDRRSTELGSRVAEALSGAVLTHLYPGSRIDVFVQVLQSDGGELAGWAKMCSMSGLKTPVSPKNPCP